MHQNLTYTGDFGFLYIKPTSPGKEKLEELKVFDS